jgi:DNA-binding XRE family transcriptional regulator
MGRSLEEIIAELPPERQERIEARYQELKQDVETLRELRKLAGKAQAEIAHSLKISQPSVSKIERGADVLLSTLRGYVEAAGGRLEPIVTLPSKPALRLKQFAEVTVERRGAGAREARRSAGVSRSRKRRLEKAS